MSARSDPTTVAGVTVRTATLNDAPRIAELSGQLGYPSTPEQVERRLRNLDGDPRHAVYLAELCNGPEPGLVIGWLHAQEIHLVESDLRAEISDLVVADGYRSRGAGRILMQHAEQWAKSRGCSAVLLRSNVIRTRAHVFYENLGYENIKNQKVFRRMLGEG